MMGSLLSPTIFLFCELTYLVFGHPTATYVMQLK